MLPGSSIKGVRNGKIGANKSIFMGFYLRGQLLASGDDGCDQIVI
jgi:hypothetical protein